MDLAAHCSGPSGVATLALMFASRPISKSKPMSGIDRTVIYSGALCKTRNVAQDEVSLLGVG
jgi:hypothetical protein